MNKLVYILLTAIIVLTGCSRYSIDTPFGFASIDKGNTELFFSPDGVRMKVSVFNNDPEKDNEFWLEALNNHLVKKGYKPYSSSEYDENGKTDYWLMTYGKDYYVYMTSVFSNSRSIVTIEAAGEKSVFENYRSVIDEAVSSIKLR